MCHSENEVPVVAHWNIGEYLPLKLQNYFVLMVSEFVRTLHQNKELHHKLKSRLDKGINTSRSLSLFLSYVLSPCIQVEELAMKTIDIIRHIRKRMMKR
mgnify:CR=1 FL=1